MAGNGFRLARSADNSRIYEMNLAGAGDINGDGITDLSFSYLLIQGEWLVSGGSVVFGKPKGSRFPPVLDPSKVNGRDGFLIKPGGSFRSIGDVNGDGVADCVLGAAEQAYVVFGRPKKGSQFPAVLDLSRLNGSNGFVFTGAGDDAGGVGPVGDLNGDGILDLTIASYVVFGRPKGVAFPAVLEASSLDGSNGFGSLARVLGLADFNGDGILDLFNEEGYAVFGRPKGVAFPAVLDPSRLDGTNGFVFDGGFSGTWDVTGDGVDDLIIGGLNPLDFVGLWVVFGHPAPVVPSYGQAGQELTIRIHGESSHFEQGLTKAAFGEGISVGVTPTADGLAELRQGQFGPVIVISPTESLAVIRIDASVTPGPRTLVFITGTERVVFRDALTVVPAGEPPASSVITLASPTTPDHGTPDEGLITVTGTKFPEQEMAAAEIGILLQPGPRATGPTVFTTASAISPFNDGMREVSFRIPDRLSFFQSRDYRVSIFGRISNSGLKGIPFASGNLASLTIDPAQAAHLTPLASSRSLRSVEATTPTAIRFINWSNQITRICWLDYERKRVLYHKPQAGTACAEPTFLTHPWVVTDNDGHRLAKFLPVEGLGMVTIQ